MLVGRYGLNHTPPKGIVEQDGPSVSDKCLGLLNTGIGQVMIAWVTLPMGKV